MAIILEKSDITALKTYKIASNLDYAYLALRFDKDPDNSTQYIDTEDFQRDWSLSDTDLLSYLQTLESRKALKINPTDVTIIWGQNERTTMSQSEVLNLKKDGLINNTTFVYYALLLDKGSSLTQDVSLSDYAGSPYNIPASLILQEIVNISKKKNDDGSKVLTIDIDTISVVWLI